MKRLLLSLAILISCASQSQQIDDFDYFTVNRTIVRNGVQAVLMCNGLFTPDVR